MDPRRDRLRKLLLPRLERAAARRIGRLRGLRPEPAADLEQEHGHLASPRARDWLSELTASSSSIERDCDVAMAHHLVRIAGEGAACDALDAFDAAWTYAVARTGDAELTAPRAWLAARERPSAAERARWAAALEPIARRAAHDWLDVRAAEVDGRREAAAQLELRRVDERAALPELATRLVAGTEDLAREARDFLAPRARDAGAWQELASALEAPAEAGRSEAPERRLRRALGWLAELGLAEPVSRSIRLLPVESPLARAVQVAPRRVAVVAGPAAGERAEREMLATAGEVLARALVDPTLPPEASWAAWPLAARTLSALAERLLARPAYVLRFLEAPRRESEQLARRFALAGALRLRWEAARLLAATTPVATRQDALELAQARLELAAGVPLPAELAALALPRRWRAELELAARLCALDVERALVERFDADFFRNPRAAQALRALASPGALATGAMLRESAGAAAASERPAETLVALLAQTGAV